MTWHLAGRRPCAVRADEPRADEPRADAPRTDAPRADKPHTNEPHAYEPHAYEPRADKPHADEPRAAEPRGAGPRAPMSRSALEAAYHAVLKTLPVRFRQRHAAELVDVFRRRVAEARAQGGRPAALVTALRELTDLVAAAIRLHARRRRPQRFVFHGLPQDLRHATRGLARRPGFTTAAVLTLGVGLAGATTVFAVADAVLFRPLPYPDSHELVMPWRVIEAADIQRGPFSYPDFVDLRAATPSLDGMAAHVLTTATLTGSEGAERVYGARVSGDFFRVLGVPPRLGRALTPADDAPDAEPVVVLADGFWRSRFGADPAILGSRVELGSTTYQVIGVAAPDFAYPDPDVRFWTALRMAAADAERDANFLRLIARLRRGASLTVATAELRAAHAGIQATYPGQNVTDDVWLEERQAYLARDLQPLMTRLAGAVALLLILAWASFTNLLLVRMSSRRGELALRAALGASAARLRRPLLLESGMIAAAAGAVGLGLGALLARLAGRLVPGGLPFETPPTLDLRVLAFALAATLITAAACGWLAAVRAARRPPSEAMRSERGGAEATQGGRARAALLVVQVAAAVVFLVSAGLLGQSFGRMMAVAPGFDPDGVLTAHLSLPADRYADPGVAGAFHDGLLQRVAALPGVAGAAGTWALPFSPTSGSSSMRGADALPGQEVEVMLTPVRGDFFGVMRAQFREGEPFPPDRLDPAPVAVVNETLARRYWPAGGAVGRQLVPADGQGQPITIVGVVADLKRTRLDEETRPEAFLPASGEPWSAQASYLIVRAYDSPAALLPSIRAILRDLDPALPLTQIATLRERIGETVAPPRFRALLTGGLAAAALIVALTGIYGVLSFIVAEQRREMAVRAALGARRGRIVAGVVARGMKLAGAGVTLGVLVALLSAGTLRVFLFDVEPYEPAVYAMVALAFLAAAAAAALTPALRAAAAQPADVLRGG